MVVVQHHLVFFSGYWCWTVKKQLLTQILATYPYLTNMKYKIIRHDILIILMIWDKKMCECLMFICWKISAEILKNLIYIYAYSSKCVLVIRFSFSKVLQCCFHNNPSVDLTVQSFPVSTSSCEQLGTSFTVPTVRNHRDDSIIIIISKLYCFSYSYTLMWTLYHIQRAQWNRMEIIHLFV